MIRPYCMQSPPCRRLRNKTRVKQVGICLRSSCSLTTAEAGGLQFLTQSQDSLNISVGLYQNRLGRTRQNVLC